MTGKRNVGRARQQQRVLIIVQNLPVPVDRRVWCECQSLVAAGFDVSVIAPRGPGDAPYEELEGVRLHRYEPPPEPRGKLGFFREFAYCWLQTFRLTLRVARNGGFDVIQACNPPDTYFLLAAPFVAVGKRFVYDQHDLCPELYQARFRRPSRFLLSFLRLLERSTYRLAHHVICPNGSYRRRALESGTVDTVDTTIVRSGPPVDRMRRQSPRPELRADRQHLCCYLGVMGPQDGVDLLLRAIAVLVHDLGRDDCHFALLGFGACFDDLRRLARELDVHDRVTFTGLADDTMISDYLSTADVALAPDPRNGFNEFCTMNKVGEYMAFGLPTVAFDLEETRVSAADSAVYVPDNDAAKFAAAVAALLDAPDRRAQMGERARRRAESHLAWAHQEGAYVGVYERLLSRDPVGVS